MLAKTIFLLVLAAVAAATETGEPFKQMANGTNECTAGYEPIISPDTCTDARSYLKGAKPTANFLGIDWANTMCAQKYCHPIEITPWVGDPEEPKGCFVRAGGRRVDRRKRKSVNDNTLYTIPNRVYFNTHGRGGARPDMSQICKEKVYGPAPINQVFAYEIQPHHTTDMLLRPLSEWTEFEIKMTKREAAKYFAARYSRDWTNLHFDDGLGIFERDIETVILSQKEQATRGRRAGNISIDMTITLRSQVDQRTAANIVESTKGGDFNFNVRDNKYGTLPSKATLQSRNEIEGCQWVMGKYLSTYASGLTEKTMPDAPGKEACATLVLEQEPSASGVTYNDGILDAVGLGSGSSEGRYTSLFKNGHGACTAIFGVTELHTPVSINSNNDPGELFPVYGDWQTSIEANNKSMYESIELTNAVYKSCKLGPTTNPSPGPTTNPSPGPTTNPSPGPTSNPPPGPTTNPSPGPTTNPSPGPTTNPSPGPTTNPTSSAPSPTDECDSKLFQQYNETGLKVASKNEAFTFITKIKTAFKAIKKSYRAAKTNLRKLGREAKE